MKAHERTRAILRAGGLTPTERLVLVALADYADQEGKCWPSVVALSEATSLSVRAVQAAMSRAEGAGWVDRLITVGRSNTYRLHLDKLPTPAPRAPPPPQEMHHTPATPAPHPRSRCTLKRTGNRTGNRIRRSDPHLSK